jgi:gluconolactonase
MKRKSLALTTGFATVLAAGMLHSCGEPADESVPGAEVPFASSPVVESGAVMERITTGHGFTEGPVYDDRTGFFYFVDIPLNSLVRIAPDGSRRTITRRSGSANGLAIDRNGTLIGCLNGDRCVVAIDTAGTYSILADRYEGKRLNNPNDCWVDNRNGIYFTDPAYYLHMTREQDGEHVYYLSPDRTTVVRVAGDLVTPNGLVGTPDNRFLYIADPGGRSIYRYRINADATLSEKTTFAESGSDGMTMDSEGNVYLTSGGIRVYNPAGELIETIPVPESPSNVAFGGPDRKTLYITARTSVYTIRMRVRGIPGL